VRTMRTLFSAVCAFAILAILVSCATSPEAQLAKANRHLVHAASLLAAKSDADSLAAAGLLNLAKHPDVSLSLIERATAAGPERPDLIWLRIQICQKAPPCDPEPVERQLRTLDASNGASWLGALARSSALGNEAAKDAALMAISRSARVDIYWTSLIVRLSRATAETKAASLLEATTVVIGYLAAEAIPAYRVASDACKGERLQHAEVVEVCRNVAKALERGDTSITEMVGIRIAERVWPENSQPWNEASEARRSWEYRSNLLSHAGEWDAPTLNEYLTLCAQNRREQDVDKALLVASGKDPNPPSK